MEVNIFKIQKFSSFNFFDICICEYTKIVILNINKINIYQKNCEEFYIIIIIIFIYLFPSVTSREFTF